jgi:hypothetical protein
MSAAVLVYLLQRYEEGTGWTTVSVWMRWAEADALAEAKGAGWRVIEADAEGALRDSIEKRRHKLGTRNPRAKLTTADAEAIRQARAAVPPVPLRVLAERYGVQAPCISKIARGQAWRQA